MQSITNFSDTQRLFCLPENLQNLQLRTADLGNFFHALADNPTSLGVVDFLNPIGLTLVGLSLVLGIAARFGAIGGIFLLALYYLSHIPYIGAEYLFPSEGSYLWVDKNVIEICALCLLMTFPTSGIIGLDRLLNRYWKKN